MFANIKRPTLMYYLLKCMEKLRWSPRVATISKIGNARIPQIVHSCGSDRPIDLICDRSTWRCWYQWNHRQTNSQPLLINIEGQTLRLITLNLPDENYASFKQTKQINHHYRCKQWTRLLLCWGDRPIWARLAHHYRQSQPPQSRGSGS